MYRLLFTTVLTRISAETAHHLSFGLLRLLMAIPPLRWAAYRVLGPRDPALRVTAFGRDLPSPLGLAAGFDKDARGCDALGALGFGFVEIGTVTARPQPGNPQPRLMRLPADRALVNRMGFNNGGSAAAADRLRRRRGRPLTVGANIGKTKLVPEAEATGDYVLSTERLAPVADYLVVNVSSPNTPGLRNLQATDQLRPLLTEVRAALHRAGRGTLPLFVKIAPDLADEDIDLVTDLAVELRLDGIIATNTTISRDGLRSSPAEVAAAGGGGLSGPPLAARSLAVLRRIHARAGNRLTLIAVGGIETADDAWDRIRAGATLVQGYTGLIYGGPLWAWRLHRGLAAHVRRAGLPSIGDAIGTAAR